MRPIRQIGVSEVTYYRWRQEFGGLKTEQIKRLKLRPVLRGRLCVRQTDHAVARTGGDMRRREFITLLGGVESSIRLTTRVARDA
jgi:hypothetical protein